jgi:hypothetical protein
MIMISLSHARKGTIDILDADMNIDKFSCLNTMKYGRNGYIIHINAKDFDTYNRFNFDMPYDLRAAVAFAIDLGYDTLCLTEEEEPLFYLPYYTYEKRPDADGYATNYEDCYCCGQLLRSLKVDSYGNEIKEDVGVKSLKDFYKK